ncbi:MAG: carboxypeptidase-like regulatory domain-containing protein [Planctomycetota bacterium]
MRALPVLLGLTLCGGLGAGLWWLRGDDLPPPPVASPEAPEAAARDDGAAAAPVTTVSRDDGREAPADEPEPAAGDDDARSLVPLTWRRSPRVLVVRGEAAVPVADAVVFFVTERDATARPGGDRTSRWEWPAAFGQRATTGPDGIAVLPVEQAPWLCSTTVGDDFAFAIVPPRDRVHTLRLLRDETLLLAARYPDGSPGAGVPIAIVQQFGDQQGQPVADTVAGRDGNAAVRHFQLVRQSRDGNPPERFAAVPRVPAAVAVQFAGRPTPDTPVELPLPPLASVRVALVDPAGSPILQRATVMLTAVRSVTFGSAAPTRLPPGLNVQRQDKPVGDAAVLLPWHQLGVPIELTAMFPTLRAPVRIGGLPAPQQPGEVVDVQFPVGAAHTLLAGRLSLGGAPLGNGRVDAALWREGRDLMQMAIETIADGRFDLLQQPRSDAAEFWLELRVDAPRAKDTPPDAPPDHRRLGARVRLPGLPAGRRLELGTIELGELQPLVTGLVVDDEANPVPDADVQVQWETTGDERRERELWRGLALLRTRTTADGRFRIDGPLPAGNLRVRADTDAHFADSVPLSRQGQEVRIKIDRNGILRGRVLLPEWLAAGTATLQLRPFDEALRQRETRSVDLTSNRGGRFVIEPLKPGRFDALVLVRNLPDPIAVVTDVFVRPGESRDGRFRPLDLRGALHRYRLRAVDGQGQPFGLDGPILARLQKADGTFAESGFRWQKGRAEIVTGSALADFTFFGRGHRTVRATYAPGEWDVQLPALRPALLELPGARALCGPARTVRVSVILQGDTGLPGSLGGVDQRSGERFGFARWDLGRSSGAWLGASDTVEVPLLQSGKYQVLLRPHATDSERSPQGEIALGVFELQVDGAGWQTVRVPVDPVAVGNALQQLDQNHAQAQARPRPEGQPRGVPRPGNR